MSETSPLGFAAAPALLVMALASARGSAPLALCGGAAAWPLGEMTTMYLVMAALHLGPWLRLARR